MAFAIGDIGPCSVEIDGVDQDDVKASVGYNQESITYKTPQRGTVTGIITDDLVTCTLTMYQATLAKLQVLVPGSTVTADELIFGNAIGQDHQTNAVILEIKPFAEGTTSTTASEFFTIARAYPTADITWDWDSETEGRVAQILFTGYPVVAADIAVGGDLYNSGSPEWSVGDKAAIGLGETS